MTYWFVHYWVHKAGKTQDYWKRFTDYPSADRFAQEIVETGPAGMAKIEEYKK